MTAATSGSTGSGVVKHLGRPRETPLEGPTGVLGVLAEALFGVGKDIVTVCQAIQAVALLARGLQVDVHLPDDLLHQDPGFPRDADGLSALVLVVDRYDELGPMVAG